MTLSALQRYILKQCFARGVLKKTDFLDFYKKNKVSPTIALKDIAKSIERLISKDLVRASGVKTAKKWYTNSVSLTPRGRKLVTLKLADQLRLPLTKKHYGKSKTN